MSDINRLGRMTLRGFSILLVITVSTLLASCIFEPAEIDDYSYYQSEFLFLWQAYDLESTCFIFHPTDWDSVYEYYYALVDTVTQPTGLYDILVEMLEPFEDASIVVWAFALDTMYTYEPQPEPNYNTDVLWDGYLEPAGFEWFQEDIWGGCMLDSIPYVLIAEWAYSLYPAYLDSVIEANAYAPAFIIDQRMNPGGSDQRIRLVANRFNDQNRLAYHEVWRAGPEHDDLQSEPFSFYAHGVTFTGPVVVLIGEENAGVSERFTTMMGELPWVTLMGDTTQGQVSEYTVYQFPGMWLFTYPLRTFLRADSSTWIQGSGIPPDIYVDYTDPEIPLNYDPVIEAALEYAQSL